MKRRVPRLVATLALSVAMPLTVIGAAAQPAAADTNWNNYEKVLLTKNTGEPIDMAILPDSKILHTARNGDVRLTDPGTGITRIINKIDVYANSEDGLQTVAVDPDFATNKWVYLYYAPRVMDGNAQNGQPYPTTTPTGNAPNTLPAGQDASYWQQWLGYNQLSRFKWNDATQSIDLSTEQKIIKVEVNRGQCCHVAGDIDWDAAGNLYLSTGDNTPASTPGANGMAPNNNAPGQNPGHDARRGAGNSNDLRGSILRIKVGDDGSYTIPAGNLWAPGTPKTRPEIFATGLRNPFRIEVDPKTNSVSWGDYGPDAGAPIAERGPMGYVEWMMTSLDRPVFGGWPYCHGPNANYNEWNYATQTQGPWFDCAAGPMNNSTWNTGIAQLPAATAPQLYYGDNASHQPWPELTNLGGGGQAPMGAPVYHYEDYPDSSVKLPAYWDNKALMAEFSQDYVVALSGNWPNGEVTKIEDFLPNAALNSAAMPIWDNVMDMEFGPDGSLYVLEYGDGFFRQNPDAGLYRIQYAAGNKSPQARMSATPISGSSAPLTVEFSAAGSIDPEGEALTYEWDFNGDGTFDATGATATHTYTELGQYQAVLRVKDPEGRFSLTSQQVTVGNQAPTVTVETPPAGAFFDWGQRVPFNITTNDAEEGTSTVCSRVSWTIGLGHGDGAEAHAHPITAGTGCTGSWATPADAPEHGETENIYLVVVANYTDAGANGVPAATGTTQLILNPKLQQAEHADVRTGVTVVEDTTASGRYKVTDFGAGDSLVYDPVNFVNVTGVQTRASGAGTLSLRWNTADAAPFATVEVPAGEGWQTVNTTFTGAPQGSGKLVVTSTGGVDVDSFTFQGTGVADVTGPVATVTANPAQPNGANGWYTTAPVSVNIAWADVSGVVNNSRQYRIVTNANQCGAADATWTNLPGNGNVSVTNQGTNVICYRANDNAGNTTTGNYTVRIDTAAPTATLPGVAEDGTVSDGIYLVPAVSDPTPGSGGVVLTGMRLDGSAISIATPINLAALSLGEHTLVVIARDAAGNVMEQSSTFTVVASYDGIAALIERYTTSRAIKPATAATLTDLLERAETATSDSREDAYLNQFIAKVRSQVTSTAVKNLLVRDAQALIAD
jgi:glucose/arabinose dehydrogenase